MTETSRSVLVLATIVMVFVLSAIGYNHIMDSYIMSEDSSYVERIEDTNDSLKTVVKGLKEIQEEQSTLISKLVVFAPDSLKIGDDDE